MTRLRPRGMIGMKTITNQSRVSYDSIVATRPQDRHVAVRTVRFFLP